ncbi:MAG TPA: ABC transporter ATP-binding protein [Synergistaceae bacterium]|nr:MAG: Oligopeptide transport ATP-binding protein OppD [Synergistetes bacterium ADurb.Bin520]HQH78474.1 ABC transporter ATP-binding protein [Synergistaceae bacterium]
MDRGNAVLQVRNLRTEFATRRGIVPAVDGVSFEVFEGKVTGLVGESGCGKSVTALSILGLVTSPPGRVARGEILFEGRDLARMTPREMGAFRGRDLSMIFQEPMTSLNPVKTVGNQVGEPLRVHLGLSAREARRRAEEMLDLVGIPEPQLRYGAFPHQLSGGLRQRVMIAMALICSPKLLVADEPTTALDVTIQAQVLDLMMGLKNRLGTAIVLITHDLGVVAETCDDVYVMYAGHIVEQGDVYRLFERPGHPYTQGLLRCVPDASKPGRRGPLASIEGAVPLLTALPPGCRFAPRCPWAQELCHRQIPDLVAVGEGHLVRCWRAEEGGKP